MTQDQQLQRIYQRRREVARDLLLDAVFLAGLGLFGWGLWQAMPTLAPLVFGLTLMLIAGAIHWNNSRGSDAA